MSTHRVGRGSLEPGVPWEAETAYHRRRTRVCHEGSWRFLGLYHDFIMKLVTHTIKHTIKT